MRNIVVVWAVVTATICACGLPGESTGGESRQDAIRVIRALSIGASVGQGGRQRESLCGFSIPAWHHQGMTDCSHCTGELDSPCRQAPLH